MKFKYWWAAVFAAIAVSACGSGAEQKIKDLEDENAVLKAEIENKEKALDEFMETFAVMDSNFTRMDELHNEIQINRNMAPKEKIAALFDEIVRLSQENEKLAKRVENTPISGKAIDKVKAELQRKIDDSNLKIQDLTRENVSLKQQLAQRQRELVSKDSMLVVKDKSLAETEKEKRKLENAVKEKEAMNQEERAKTLFAEGKNFEDLGDKTNATFKPKERRELYQKACEKYMEAKKLGHPQAAVKIQDINDKLKGKGACPN